MRVTAYVCVCVCACVCECVRACKSPIAPKRRSKREAPCASHIDYLRNRYNHREHLYVLLAAQELLRMNPFVCSMRSLILFSCARVLCAFSFIKTCMNCRGRVGPNPKMHGFPHMAPKQEKTKKGASR